MLIKGCFPLLFLENANHSLITDAAMAKPSTRNLNKQKRERKLGLQSKLYNFWKLGGVDLLLVIFNQKKEEYYTFWLTKEKKWPRIEEIVSFPINIGHC